MERPPIQRRLCVPVCIDLDNLHCWLTCIDGKGSPQSDTRGRENHYVYMIVKGGLFSGNPISIVH